MTRRNHISFLFYQIMGHVALFLFGIIFALSMIGDNKDVTMDSLRGWWEIIWR